MNRFAAVRAGYGALLLSAPGPVIRLYTGHRADPRTRMVTRVLGARHLAQAVATAGTPDRSLLALGVEADLAHTASMLALAAVDREHRRAGVVDAISASSFAVVGAVLTRRAGRAAIAPFHPGERPLGGLAALRNRLVAGVARWLLPASLRARSVRPPPS